MPPITTSRRRKPRANWLTHAHLKNAGGGVALPNDSRDDRLIELRFYVPLNTI